MTKGQTKVKRYLDGVGNGAKDADKVRNFGKMIGILVSQEQKDAAKSVAEAITALVAGKDAAARVRKACTEVAKTLPNE